MIRDYLNKELEKRKSRLQEIQKRAEELEAVNESSEVVEELEKTSEELETLRVEKESLETEVKELEEQVADLDKPADNQAQRKLNFMNKEERKGGNNMTIEERKAKAIEFKETGRTTIETRALQIAGGQLVTPTGVEGVNGLSTVVSSIVDLVKIVNCHGMGSNKVAYQKTHSTADAKTEGQASSTSEPTFGFVEIRPETRGILSFVSDQVTKQTPLDYEAKTKESATYALKVDVAKLLTSKLVASTLNTKLAGTVKAGAGAIDEKTLRNIVLNYGGAEHVEGQAWLFLNKKDLIAFGDVRGANEKKAVYEIEPNETNPNIGIIRDGGVAVNYCIDSNLHALSGTKQPLVSGSDLATMVYGNPKNLELDLFGDFEIKVSEDYKFAENMLTIRGQVDCGADVVKQDAFVVINLPKASA